jgi:hypothetical protein
MKPTSDNKPLVLPAALMAEVEAAAEQEHRPVADLLREFVERGLDERRWQAHSGKELQRALEIGLSDADDGQRISEAYRQAIREKIAQGLASAREGRLVDGAAVFARIRTEMTELERQGRG